MNQIEQMFALQKQLNDSTNGEIWIKGLTKENRKISWYRGIYMEVAEAIDSFNWKHWKNINDQPCLLYTSPSPRDATLSRMPSSA